MNLIVESTLSLKGSVAQENQKLCNQARSSFSLESLQHLDREAVVCCQSMIGHGSNFGIWETPYSLTGRRFIKSSTRIDLRERLEHFLPKTLPSSSQRLAEFVDEGVLWLTRYALLCRLGPASMGRYRSRGLDVTTIFNKLFQHSPKLIARGMVRRLDGKATEDLGFIQNLTTDDLSEFKKNQYLAYELKRISKFVDMGLWEDGPTKVQLPKNTNPKSDAAKRPKEKKSQPYPPIPDDYLAEMAPRIMWVVFDLGPNLIHLLEAIPTIVGGLPNGITNSRISIEGETELKRYLKRQVWRDRHGKPIMFPPPYLRVANLGKSNLDWPPTSLQIIKALIVTLQSAHLWIVLLAMAGRVSEIQSLRQNCVEWSQDGKHFVNGKTYKLSQHLMGEDRRWPAPEIFVDALAQQSRLTRARWRIFAMIDHSTDDDQSLQVKAGHLWASFGKGCPTKFDPSDEWIIGVPHLIILAERLDMSPKPAGKNLHPHRFRKTIARLVGIAAVDSPRVLMQLLGHRDIAMTMHYILTDKALRVEIEKVTRELRIMRCIDVIDDIHTSLQLSDAPAFGGHGGGATSVLADAIKLKAHELHQQGQDWDVQTTYDLAVHLTCGGQFFRIIRPGVVCLKEDRKAGLCKCDSSCFNRIEEKTARRDVNELIPYLIEQGLQALANNELLLLSNIVAQLQAELARFDDIRTEWQVKPEVIKLFEAAA